MSGQPCFYIKVRSKAAASGPFADEEGADKIGRVDVVSDVLVGNGRWREEPDNYRVARWPKGPVRPDSPAIDLKKCLSSKKPTLTTVRVIRFVSRLRNSRLCTLLNVFQGNLAKLVDSEDGSYSFLQPMPIFFVTLRCVQSWGKRFKDGKRRLIELRVTEC